MFSPAGAGRRSTRRTARQGQNVGDSPTSGRQLYNTPAPKHSSISLRVTPTILQSGEKSIADGCDPVFVCDFPHQFRNLAVEAQRSGARGGMDEESGSGLSWMLYKNQVFLWSHLGHSTDCKILSIPSELCTPYGHDIDPKHGNDWLIRIVDRNSTKRREIDFIQGTVSAGLVMCSQKSAALAYWPDISKDSQMLPVCHTAAVGNLASSNLGDDRYGASRRSFVTPSSSSKLVNSLIVSDSGELDCVAIASCSSGEVWRFDCTISGVSHNRITRETGQKSVQSFGPFDFNKSDAGRALVWRSRANTGWRECLLLTSRRIECWDVELLRNGKLSKAWSFDISEDVATAKDMSGQKQIWLLDLKVSEGNTLVVLTASLDKDRVNSSSYTQYSLLTFLYVGPSNRRPADAQPQVEWLKKKAPVQVILPNARVEEEDFLYSMKLRVGGKPAGSAMILAGDGVATVSHYLHGVARLYQFDLAWDAGKVLDASVLPSLEENEEGAWLVLTEKAGVWAIPEKAVLLGSVEPPERSLSRRGSKNDETIEQRRKFALETDGDISPETKPVVSSQRPLQDEEAEALIGRLFQQFVSSRQAAGVLEKLQKAGAFEVDGEMNIFARFSKSVVDSIAKQWTSGGAGAAIMMGISSHLTEKQRRHQQYLNFLATSGCHEVMQVEQRNSLNIIMEHGEKLAAISKLKDMYNSRQSNGVDDPDVSDLYGAIWDTIQLVGEKARRKNVMLMDREKVEVFFTRVSELEDLFLCVKEHGHLIVEQDMTVQRVCDLSDACTMPLRAAIQYKDSQQMWYPSLEGITPWYCNAVVRSGIWKAASLIISLQETLDSQSKDKLMVCLEELADILLESYVGAIAAKIDREEDYRALQTEYWSRRDALLPVLVQYSREVADLAAEHADDQETRERLRLSVLRTRYGSLLPMARRHAAYQTLWDICIDLNDMQCLRLLMRESMGLKEGRFSNYVFEQFSKKGQHAKLLRLGEEFSEELASFLQGQKSLSWLHDIFLKRFSLASTTLHHLAQSNGVKEDTTTTISARRKLLYLAKLTALAAGTRESQERALQIDADVGILAVQELAAELGLTGAEPLPALQLVELCINSEHRELIIRSLDVFALAGDIFRRGNKSLLQQLWLRLVDQDYWIKMKEACEEEGWTEEQQCKALKTTALFAASKYCYGGTGFVRGLPFEDTLPAFRKSSLEAKSSISGAAGSVEEVLMQHPDFPEAGEAMLTAIRMGQDVKLDDSMEL